MVGKTVKENQVRTWQIPNTSQELIMLICLRVYFCMLFPSLQLLLAKLTALTFRLSPLQQHCGPDSSLSCSAFKVLVQRAETSAIPPARASHTLWVQRPPLGAEQQ